VTPASDRDADPYDVVTHLVAHGTSLPAQCPTEPQAHQAPNQALLHGPNCQNVRMQVLEERTGDLHRQLLLAQSELKAAQEDSHIQDLDKAHLQTQLAGIHAHLMRKTGCSGKTRLVPHVPCAS